MSEFAEGAAAAHRNAAARGDGRPPSLLPVVGLIAIALALAGVAVDVAIALYTLVGVVGVAVTASLLAFLGLMAVFPLLSGSRTATRESAGRSLIPMPSGDAVSVGLAVVAAVASGLSVYLSLQIVDQLYLSF